MHKSLNFGKKILMEDDSHVNFEQIASLFITNIKPRRDGIWCLKAKFRIPKTWVFKILSEFSNFEWVFQANNTIFPNTMDFQWNVA